MRTGFDHDLYTRMQSDNIRSRIAAFGGKLYLELGGKLFDDFHASRVLPGFKPDSKVSMLLNLKDQAELVVAINADDIEKSKVRGDLGISYDADVLRLIDAFRGIGMYVGSVVLTRWRDQHSAVMFKNRLESLGVRVFRHFPIEGYPYDVEQIVSDRGFGRNEYVETTRPLVLALIYIVLFRAKVCDPVAALLPLLFAQVAIKVLEFFRNDKKGGDTAP